MESFAVGETDAIEIRAACEYLNIYHIINILFIAEALNQNSLIGRLLSTMHKNTNKRFNFEVQEYVSNTQDLSDELHDRVRDTLQQCNDDDSQ